MNSLASRPLLLGHRGAGAAKLVPENTLASFDQALGDGCDGFEFDVRLTEDGESVIAHDPRFGKYKIERTLAQQVSTLPRLRDVLKRYQDKAFLDIEVKVKGLERTIVDLFLRHKPRKGCVVSSFLPSAIKALHEHDASIPLGLICETPTQLRQWSELPVGWVIAHYELCEAELVRKVKGAGKKIMVWTGNGAAEMKGFAELGVDGLISDETALLCRTLKEEDDHGG